ncbi:MAG: sigma-70 family RNA polymerase sigma factor [Burkholderiaceae bacterium]|jgi:RNA polymerase sigma-70 factor (ECF subfamily)|nr:sigma-70 family RNA polymerase sigma factor [Betaproteobacteria bacterium]MBP6645782.1 sigma-70 family RNA polymerase sigma factor [Burkholderiaceae bacterium]
MMTLQTTATTDITSGLSSATQADAITLGWTDLIPHRDYLIRYAARKLHDPALAEDVVHDVFEAVITGRANFEGRASLRSWLTGVLKFKLVDLIRQRVRYDSTDGGSYDDDSSATDAIECSNPGPQDLAEQRELLTQVLKRIDALPPGLREVMLFRVLHEEPSATVCKRLGITETSLFVRLHRARKQLMC